MMYDVISAVCECHTLVFNSNKKSSAESKDGGAFFFLVLTSELKRLTIPRMIDEQTADSTLIEPIPRSKFQRIALSRQEKI